jgi:hypothetical protein
MISIAIEKYNELRLLFRISFAILKNIDMFAGGLIRVEKVKPDPLNLLVKTDVGSNKWKE